MDAEIAGQDENGLGVRVFDNDGIEHQITMDWDGNIEHHGVDEYPSSTAERTDEEEVVMQQVRAKAEYFAHTETDAEMLSPHWNPAVLKRAIEGLRTMDDEKFRKYFADYYEALQTPPNGVDLQQIDLVFLGVTVGDTAITDIGEIQYSIEDDAGEQAWVGPEDDSIHNVVFTLPMYEFEWSFEERFREFLIHHLKCKIRDIHLNMGEDPPEEYAVDGYGKVVTNAFPAEE